MAGELQGFLVIPARLASTRLPRKLLLAETGQPLIQHTYQAAQRAKRALGIVVAADHEEIAAAVRAFDGRVVMTSPNCASGTDRVAEVARQMPEVDIFVNVQGDEPEISGEAIDLAIELLERDPSAVMATLATPIRSREKLDWDDALLSSEPPAFLQHIGLYAYRRDFLLQIAKLERCELEKTESLEQLRVLYHGYAIQVGLIDEPAIGIDTPADYAAFVQRWQRQ